MFTPVMHLVRSLGPSLNLVVFTVQFTFILVDRGLVVDGELCVRVDTDAHIADVRVDLPRLVSENRFKIIKQNLVSLGDGDGGIVGGRRVKDRRQLTRRGRKGLTRARSSPWWWSQRV